MNKDELKRKYPYLIEDAGNSLVTAAKNVRIELKRAFPNVTFKVHTKRFSMGDDLTVHWTDGPTSKQVDAIIQKYSAGSFDGSVDLYNYHNDPFTDVFGDAKYVFATRSYSDELLAWAIAELKREYNSDEEITVEMFHTGKLWNKSPMIGTNGELHWQWQELIHRKCGETDCTKVKTNTRSIEQEIARLEAENNQMRARL